MLRRDDFKKDTYELTQWAIHKYLASNDSTNDLSAIVVEKVLKDEQTILPELNKLLRDYLHDDFTNVSNLMEEALVNTLKIRGIRNGMNEAVTQSAQDNLNDPKIYDFIVSKTRETLKK